MIPGSHVVKRGARVHVYRIHKVLCTQTQVKVRLLTIFEERKERAEIENEEGIVSKRINTF